jgi:hypothetical protein
MTTSLPLMTPVVSSNIAALGYETESGCLFVTFNTAKTYRYENVPEAVHTEILASNSKGRTFNRLVRDTPSEQYPFRLVG